MNVSLGPQMESFVEDLVNGGSYQSNSEVLRAALRLLKDHETLRQIKLDEMQREVQIGLDQKARGEVSPWDVEEIKREGRRLLAEKKKRGA